MTTLDTHKVIRPDGSRVTYGARLVHAADGREWRYRGIHAVPATPRGSGIILAHRAGENGEPKRFAGSAFGVRVVAIDVEREDSAFADAAADDPGLSDGEPVGREPYNPPPGEPVEEFAAYKRPTSADEYAATLADLIRTMWGAEGLKAAGPTVIHVRPDVVYVIEVHTVKNGPV